MIDSFRGKYYFLSNFYECPVQYDGILYRNNEAAFQAQKTLDVEKRKEFASLSPDLAKRAGRRAVLRQDWEQVKYDIMYGICRAKFTQNPELGKLLAATGDEELVEGNNWGDRIWGQVNGKGQNHLGKILMRIRKEIRDEDT